MESQRLDVLNNPLGSSKNYVTSRGGMGVDDFVTYRYVYLKGEGVIYEILPNSR